MLRAGDVNFLALVEGGEFGDAPGLDAVGSEFHTVVAIVRGRGEGDGLHEAGTGELHAGPVGSGGAGDFFPAVVVVGGGDDVGPAGGGQWSVHAAEPEVNAVELRRRAIAFEVELDPGLVAGDVDGGGDVAVEENFALLLRQDAAARCGRDNPLREVLFLDAVGDELCGEVVVVRAGLIRGAIEGEIAVGGRVDDEGRAGVFLWIARINADAAGEVELCVGAGSQGRDSEDQGKNWENEALQRVALSSTTVSGNMGRIVPRFTGAGGARRLACGGCAVAQRRMLQSVILNGWAVVAAQIKNGGQRVKTCSGIGY